MQPGLFAVQGGTRALRTNGEEFRCAVAGDAFAGWRGIDELPFRVHPELPIGGVVCDDPVLEGRLPQFPVSLPPLQFRRGAFASQLVRPSGVQRRGQVEDLPHEDRNTRLSQNLKQAVGLPLPQEELGSLRSFLAFSTTACL